VLLRVVLADRLDRAPVTLGPGVGDDDAVVRRAHLAQAHELDLGGHGGWCTPRTLCGCSPERRVGLRRGGAMDTVGNGERAAAAVFDPPLCQTSEGSSLRGVVGPRAAHL